MWLGYSTPDASCELFIVMFSYDCRAHMHGKPSRLVTHASLDAMPLSFPASITQNTRNQQTIPRNLTFVRLAIFPKTQCSVFRSENAIVLLLEGDVS